MQAENPVRKTSSNLIKHFYALYAFDKRHTKVTKGEKMRYILANS